MPEYEARQSANALITYVDGDMQNFIDTVKIASSDIHVLDKAKIDHLITTRYSPKAQVTRIERFLDIIAGADTK